MSQEDLGRKLGFGDQWKTYQSYESGRTKPFPPELKSEIEKMGYTGPWPDEAGGEVTREDLNREVEEIRREMRIGMAALHNEVRQMVQWAQKENHKEHRTLGAALAECLKMLGGDPGTPLEELTGPDSQ